MSHEGRPDESFATAASRLGGVAAPSQQTFHGETGHLSEFTGDQLGMVHSPTSAVFVGGRRPGHRVEDAAQITVFGAQRIEEKQCEWTREPATVAVLQCDDHVLDVAVEHAGRVHAVGKSDPVRPGK